MTDRKRDGLDNLMDFILSDESPVSADERSDAELFDKAIASAEAKLARTRLDRAKAGVTASRRASGVGFDLESGRRLLARANAGDQSARVTLAARFGDGSLDGDLDAIIEDLAELKAENGEED